jgi:hypothetical protein
MTVHSARSRVRAVGSTGSTRASLTSVEVPSSPGSVQCANSTRTVPGSSHARNSFAPEIRG